MVAGGAVVVGKYEKFLDSKQPGVKLSIAAEDYFLPETSREHRKAYGDYLRLRLRPAAELLVRQEKISSLEGLWELQCFSESLLNELLTLASREQKNTAYVWLLRKKRDSFGFTLRNYEF